MTRSFVRRLPLCFSFAALAALSGCGASRSEVPAAKLSLDKLTGGSYLTGCLSGDRLWAVRSYELELWTLTKRTTPTLDQRIKAPLPPDGTPMVQVACDGSRALALLEGGDALGVDVTGVVWRGKAEDATSWPMLDTAAKREPPQGVRWADRMSDGREVLLGDFGRATRYGSEIMDWRAAAGGLIDAVWDGSYIWAISTDALWRWEPTKGGPTAVALPDSVSGRGFKAIFRDGGYLWVRDTADMGFPLQVKQDGRATLAVGQGTLAPLDPKWTAPIASGQIEATRGQSGLTVLQSNGVSAALETLAPVDSFALADSHTLVTGEGAELVVRAFDNSMKMTQLARIHFGSRTTSILAVPIEDPEYTSQKQAYELALAEYNDSRRQGLYATRPEPPEEPLKSKIALYLTGAEYGFAQIILTLDYTN